MLFNSLDFALFLPLVFVLYWLIPAVRLRMQNSLLLFASYYFYGCWDWRFLGLIAFSTVVDYLVGIAMENSQEERKRKFLLGISLTVNLGVLGLFKYFNFFVDNLQELGSFLGLSLSFRGLELILPVGISFYTFQTLSYSIDVYRGKLKASRDFIAFAAFVSFFPQLVAGPIERATHLLPQFKRKRSFSYDQAVDGLRQMLWGLFKKVVIADKCAMHVNEIFNNSGDYSGSTLFIGAVLFSFQIYGDFSGYSDIAIGTARLFGFDLKRNFAFPYFSRNMAEFWRRWHISLSTWFRDYLYIPLGGSRGSQWQKIRNTFIIFLVSGFWHGANWTFIIWGGLNALYFMPILLRGKNRNYLEIVALDSYLPSLKELGQILITFLLTVLAWVFFRADDLGHATEYLSGLFSDPDSYMDRAIYYSYRMVFRLVLIMLLIEWIGRREPHALAFVKVIKWRGIRWMLYILMIGMIGLWMRTEESPFIYFQF